MKKKQKGFTLLEIVMAVTISAIIIFGVFGILEVSNGHLQVIHAKMTLQESPREALFKMAQEIRQTAWHKIESLGEPGTDGIERSDTITFVVPVPDPDPQYLVDINYTPKWANAVQYKLDETTHQILRISTDLLTNVKRQAVLANEVLSLEFSRASTTPGLITIQATAQRELPSGKKVPEEPIRIIAQAEARNP